MQDRSAVSLSSHLKVDPRWMSGDTLSRALAELASTPLDQLRGKHLEAEEFDALLADDPIRDLLQWMADPQASQLRRGEERWSALTSIWKKDFKFNPNT